MPEDRLRIARECCRAYESGDRRVVEQHLSADLALFGEGRRARFCDTEVLTFAGDEICRVEVPFGWNLT